MPADQLTGARDVNGDKDSFAIYHFPFLICHRFGRRSSQHIASISCISWIAFDPSPKTIHELPETDEINDKSEM